MTAAAGSGGGFGGRNAPAATGVQRLLIGTAHCRGENLIGKPPITNPPARHWRLSPSIVPRVSRAVNPRGGALLGLCGIVLLWASMFHVLSTEREQVLRDATQNTSNLARAFEENIVRTLRSVDQTLLLIRAAHLSNPGSFDIADWARDASALTGLDLQVGMIDRRGFLANSNYGTTKAPVDLSDRAHFRVPRDNPRDELFISKPLMGRVSHKRTIQMSRRLLARDGSFDGVAVLSLDPDDLSRFYGTVDLGKRGVVTIASLDGTILATGRDAGRGESMIGRSMAGAAVIRAAATAPTGTLRAASQSDGVRRIFSWRVVRGYPLIVIVGVADDEVLRGFRANRVVYVILAVLLTVLALAVAVVTSLRQRRLLRAREQLRESEAAYAQKSEILRTTLEYMS